MAFTSDSTSNPQIEELVRSTSSSTAMPAFVRYEPPTAKVAFQTNKRYHLFLSFRGPDVRKTLVDHLFEALSTAGLNVFIDSEKLEKGEIIGESLERAIESSAIRIPVFSKGYAESAWCLREAAAMFRSPGLIIPLFYYVDPAHVRYPLNAYSCYNQAFLKHYGHLDRYPREEIDRWKDALHQICSRSGWSTDITEGFEARLVKTVVTDLIKTLDRVPLQVAKHPVGLYNVKDLLIHKLNLNSVDEVVKVGICGLGGIGKSTVAKAVYNQIYTEFQAASFVANVRLTAAEIAGLINLQKQVLKDFTKIDETVNNVDQGISLFKDRLRGKRVLMILDDVDSIGQLNALVGDWLAPGSRVIITSRDTHILNNAHVPAKSIHEMRGLEINEGLQLFSWHAFLRVCPTPSYEDLSRKIVEACKGHPLSLEVIGSFLHDKQTNKVFWTEALKNIILHPEIRERLYISYSALTDTEKEIFVDICCFFIGEHKRLPIIFWKSLYTKVETSVSNLSMKLLIKIDNKGVFNMHSHLRDLGRVIAVEEKQGTRLWKASHLSSLSNNINFSHLWLNGGNLQRHKLVRRLDIRYLHLQNVHIEDMRAMFPPKLIWLRMENCTFAMNKTLTAMRNWHRALLKKDHSSSVDNIKQLKIMQLTDSTIRSMPPLFSLPNAQKMQYLDLRECTSLNSLPKSIRNLSQLKHLCLRKCDDLNKLPGGIGNLSHLQRLDLIGCRKFKNLPDSIGNLSQLRQLNLEGCYRFQAGCNRLEVLPDSIGNMPQLQHLNLVGSRKLKTLPDTIGKLSQLKQLNLEGCHKLAELPDSIGNLSQLQQLNLEWCYCLEELPDSIGNLSQLKHLNLNCCEMLNNLPDSIGNLSQLQQLTLEGCEKLKELPDSIGNLSQLQHLNLEGCERLEELPDSIGNLSQLQYLRCCEMLNNLPDGIGNLSQLQHLYLIWCKNLNKLPDCIGNLSQLQQLSSIGCRKLKNLPNSIGNLSQLQHLDLNRCEINKLPDSIGNLSQLQQLNLEGCYRLEELPNSMGNLSQLQHLNLKGCSRLVELSDSIRNLSQLQHLNLEGCYRLEELSDRIGNLSQLQYLNLEQCYRLEELPDSIGNLSQLQLLNLVGSRKFKNLPDSIGNLSQLQQLNLEGCERLEELPDSIGNLLQLQHLNLEGCERLEELPHSIGELSQLQHLNLKGCRKLKKLPDSIENLSQIQHLNLEGCEQLEELSTTT